jgi:hypothetical protein
VSLWQEDFWREVVKAALAGTPDAVGLDWHQAMNAPAATRYSATTPTLLRSFDHYNKDKPPTEQVRPSTSCFGFTGRRLSSSHVRAF